MKAEIGIKMDSISINDFGNNHYEMLIEGKDGGFIYIVGDNDLPKLLQDALSNIRKYS